MIDERVLREIRQNALGAAAQITVLIIVCVFVVKSVIY